MLKGVMDEDYPVFLHTLPSGLSLRYSEVVDGKLGIWSKEDIPIGTRFGPYEGTITCDLEQAQQSGFCWKIKKERNVTWFVDAKDERLSNWLRYVNCSYDEKQQNLAILQCQGEIYFLTCKFIAANTELFIWYAKNFRKDSRIQRKEEASSGCQKEKCEVKHIVASHSCRSEKFTRRLYDNSSHSCKEYKIHEAMLTNRNALQLSLYDNNHCQKQKLTTKKTKPYKDNGTQEISKHLYCHSHKLSQFRQMPLKHVLCDKSLVNSSSDLCYHSKLHNKERFSACQSCHQYFMQRKKRNSTPIHYSGICKQKICSRNIEKCGKEFNPVGNKHTCNLCHRKFLHYSHLQMHMFRNSEIKTWKCKFCLKRFLKSCYMDMHKNLNAKKTCAGCCISHKEFSHNASSQNDAREEHDSKYNALCKNFTQYGRLNNHTVMYTENKLHTHDIYNKKFHCPIHLQECTKIPKRQRNYEWNVHHKKSIHTNNLYKHQEIDTKEKTYKFECDKIFKYHNNLARHKKIYSGQKLYRCNICHKSFVFEKNFLGHKKLHTRKRWYHCLVCKEEFPHSILKTHIKSPEHCNKYVVNNSLHKPIFYTDLRCNYKCDLCQSRFMNINDFKLYGKKHTVQNSPQFNFHYKRLVKCNQVESYEMETVLNKLHTKPITRCKQKQTLQATSLEDAGKKGTVTDVYHKTPNESVSLQNSDIFPVGNNYKCDICNKNFTTNNELEMHKEVHILTEEKLLTNDLETTKKHLKKGEKCQIEDISSKSNKFSEQLQDVYADSRNLETEKPFECDICHKNFMKYSCLCQHKRTHFKIRRYECKICHKRFTHRPYLRDHERIHTGEKPYKCSSCSRAFVQRCNLQRHERLHSGEKKFSCNICHYRFMYKVDLVAHHWVHSGEKPYNCEICQKKFVRSGHLATHRKIHFGEHLLECDICHRKFTLKKYLTSHKNRHLQMNET